MVISLDRTLRFIEGVIYKSALSWTEKYNDLTVVRDAFPDIRDFLQIPTENGPLVRSVDTRLDIFGSARFNKLAFLDTDRDSAGNDWLSYNYYSGILIYSSPSELKTNTGYDLDLLKKYGFDLNLPMILPTELGLLLKSQRVMDKKVIFDVHQIFSRPQYIGITPSNLGVSVNILGHLVTSQFALKDDRGKKLYFIL